MGPKGTVQTRIRERPCEANKTRTKLSWRFAELNAFRAWSCAISDIAILVYRTEDPSCNVSAQYERRAHA